MCNNYRLEVDVASIAEDFANLKIKVRFPEGTPNVLAELPDSPPRRFTWRVISRRIVRAEGPERVTGEWWRRAPERLAVRDYFRVEDEGGQRFWLFRRGDGVRGETGDLNWLVHGVGD